ncbi:MAG: hypothetical protein ACPKPY_10905, partial [Nitrososphaeraceae archaeon]
MSSDNPDIVNDPIIQEFIEKIRTQQLEESLKLSNVKSKKIGNKTYSKRTLSGKQWREIVRINTAMAKEKDQLKKIDLLLE